MPDREMISPSVPILTFDGRSRRVPATSGSGGVSMLTSTTTLPSSDFDSGGNLGSSVAAATAASRIAVPRGSTG